MKVHYTSNTNEWFTPDYIYRPLNERFKFTLDPCCTVESAKCKKFYTVADDGLKQDWGQNVVWVNPPYSRGVQAAFIRKAYESSLQGATVVMLIPARTETKVFSEYCTKASEIIFIVGRVKFISDKGGKPAPAPFPSAIVVFGKYNMDRPHITWQKFEESI